MTKGNMFIRVFIVITALFFIYLSDTAGQYKEVNVERTKLDNGMTVVYHEDHSAPVISTVMQYGIGSAAEGKEQRGFANFMKNLAMGGTENIPAGKQTEYLKEAAGSMDNFVSFDRTEFSIRVPSSEIKLALWIEAERMRKLKFDSLNIETARKATIDEIEHLYEEKPYGSIMDKICGSCFIGSFYDWYPVTGKEHIKKATKEDLKSFYDSFYRPDNATLIISGDIDIFEVKKYVKRYFGKYEKGAAEDYKFTAPDTLRNKHYEEISDENAVLPAVYIGYRGPSVKDPAHYALRLFNSIMTQGKSSGFYKRMVTDEKIAKEVTAMPLFLRHSGADFFKIVVAQDEDPKDVIDAFNNELERFIRDGVKEHELERVKSMYEAEFVFSRKNVLSKALKIAQYNGVNENVDLVNTEFEKINEITKEDILKAVKEFFTTEKNFTFIYYPKGYTD